jgi:hypothetical protein
MKKWKASLIFPFISSMGIPIKVGEVHMRRKKGSEEKKKYLRMKRLLHTINNICVTGKIL